MLTSSGQMQQLMTPVKLEVGRGGLYLYVNKAWCMDSAIIERHCSANLEYLIVKCRPFCVPREFTSTVVTAAYIRMLMLSLQVCM